MTNTTSEQDACPECGRAMQGDAAQPWCGCGYYPGNPHLPQQPAKARKPAAGPVYTEGPELLKRMFRLGTRRGGRR